MHANEGAMTQLVIVRINNNKRLSLKQAIEKLFDQRDRLSVEHKNELKKNSTERTRWIGETKRDRKWSNHTKTRVTVSRYNSCLLIFCYIVHWNKQLDSSFILVVKASKTSPYCKSVASLCVFVFIFFRVSVAALCCRYSPLFVCIKWELVVFSFLFAVSLTLSFSFSLKS